MTLYLKTHSDDAITLPELARALKAMRFGDVEQLAAELELMRSQGRRESSARIRGVHVFDAARALAEDKP